MDCSQCVGCRYHIASRDVCVLVLASEGQRNTFEIAEVMGVSAEYVRKVINRAMLKLQQRVDEDAARSAGAPSPPPVSLFSMLQTKTHDDDSYRSLAHYSD